MSYDIDIVDPITKEVIELPSEHQIKGGTYAMGGTTEATLNITYNYYPFFKLVFGEKGIRSLYGRSVRETIPDIFNAIASLHGEPDDDYWAATEGNARKALEDLLDLAKLAPDGEWSGD